MRLLRIADAPVRLLTIHIKYGVTFLLLQMHRCICYENSRHTGSLATYIADAPVHLIYIEKTGHVYMYSDTPTYSSRTGASAPIATPEATFDPKKDEKYLEDYGPIPISIR